MSGASTRMRRVDALVREVVAEGVTRLSDPRLRDITITRAKASSDLRVATVWWTTLHPEQRDGAGEALESARGVLQGRVGAVVQGRNTPQLRFEHDDHQRQAEHLTRLIDELAPPDTE